MAIGFLETDEIELADIILVYDPAKAGFVINQIECTDEFRRTPPYSKVIPTLNSKEKSFDSEISILKNILPIDKLIAISNKLVVENNVIPTILQYYNDGTTLVFCGKGEELSYGSVASKNGTLRLAIPRNYDSGVGVHQIFVYKSMMYICEGDKIINHILYCPDLHADLKEAFLKRDLGTIRRAFDLGNMQDPDMQDESSAKKDELREQIIGSMEKNEVGEFGCVAKALAIIAPEIQQILGKGRAA